LIEEGEIRVNERLIEERRHEVHRRVRKKERERERERERVRERESKPIANERDMVRSERGSE